MDDITVLELKPVEKGNLKAFVAIAVHGIVIRDCRIVQQPGQATWVSPPQQSYEIGGEKKWKAIVEFPKELRRPIEAAVLRAWQKESPQQPRPRQYEEIGDHSEIDGGDWPRGGGHR
jgi:DNA-binding cell septation regulator SpoVG